MRTIILALAIAAGAPTLDSQELNPPVISAVVNSASYVKAGFQDHSIATILGTNLATATATAQTVPLPIQLGGASVTVNGVPAHLFYASPSQINFEIVGDANMDKSGLVVTTSAGSSTPYPLPASLSYEPMGIFTMDSSGCGRGASLNVGSTGALSINSPANSASPGDWISVFGTGGGYFYSAPLAGYPAPARPLAESNFGVDSFFDFEIAPADIHEWTGLAPGLVAVAQMNIHVPRSVRQGCAVPLQVQYGGGGGAISQPVTLSIHQGGGQCVDPPVAGYGEIVWQRIFDTPNLLTTTETDAVMVSLQASPGKQAPSSPAFDNAVPGYFSTSGPSCPIPGYRSLAAGAVVARMPGGARGAAFVPRQDSMITGRNLYQLMLPPQVSGLRVYQATLPSGSIQAGTYSLTASGGADIGAFQSTLQIGAPIQIVTPLFGRVFSCDPVTITWTGGDPKAWVTASLVNNSYYSSVQAPVSDGHLTVYPPPVCSPGGGVIPVALVIEVEPDPSEVRTFSAPGLSLGGRHLWRYVYTFGGVTISY